MCVLDNVIPLERIEAVREEVDRVTRAATGETAGQATHKEQADALSQNLIARMPLFREYLVHPVVLDVARQMLDDHVRMAQLNLRTIRGDEGDQKGGVAWAASHTRHSREWHTDWPHDLNGYGGDNAERNAGAVRQPFPGAQLLAAFLQPQNRSRPHTASKAVLSCLWRRGSADICMCLSMVWYLSDTGVESGGTWCVPGSHRSALNPRGPVDGITVSAPIPGELQCEGPAGSLFIQDTRTWHSSACWSPRPRTALVVRFAPWWLSVGEFGQVRSVALITRETAMMRDTMGACVVAA